MIREEDTFESIPTEPSIEREETRANLPGGWVGFDAANRCCPDARYIRLGSGFDAQDAAPIRGIARGPGSETMDVTVVVAPGAAQSQSQEQQQ